MGRYVALQPLTLGGVNYMGGDDLPSEFIDPERVGSAIYAGVLVYHCDPGESYNGLWPGEHHHYSTAMQAVLDAAIEAARQEAPAPAPKATKSKAKPKPAVEGDAATDD